MSNKNLTQGGQVVFYMISMFLQINKIIFKYLFFLFLILSVLVFFILNAKRFDAIKMAYYYYIAKISSFGHNGSITMHLSGRTFEGRVNDILNNKEFIRASDFFLNQVYISVTVSLVICVIIAIISFRYLTSKGKKQSEDDYISGRKFEKNYKNVAKLLKKEKINSDIVIGGLPILKDSEIQHILFHGTTGTGKSTALNQLIQQVLIRTLQSRGDKVIIYDRGNTFLPKFFNADIDYILNPLDERCSAWSLWDECKTKPEFETFAACLVPEQGSSDPFWTSAPRTLISSIGYQIRDEKPTYKKYLKYLLNVDWPTLKSLLKDTESENLVDGKAEKTSTSIRNVITTHAKSLAYMDGLDKKNKSNKQLVIKEWLTNPDDKGALYLTSNGSQHEAIKSLITAWLAICVNSLYQLGEDRNRRVWFFLDEIDTLHKLPVLNNIMAEGRKFGSCFVIGLQNFAQLEETYGVKSATSLLDLLNTRYFFRSPNYDIAKKVSEQIGKTRFNVFNEQYAYGKSEVRDGVSFNKKEEEREIVSPYDIQQLPNLMCYVTYPAQVPVTILKLKYKEYAPKAIGFIPREIDNLVENVSKDTKKSSDNNGQEINIIEPSPIQQTEISDKTEMEQKTKDNTDKEIGNRDEININEDQHEINHEYQL